MTRGDTFTLTAAQTHSSLQLRCKPLDKIMQTGQNVALHPGRSCKRPAL